MGCKSWEPLGPEHISSLIAGAGRVMSHVWIRMFVCSTVCVHHTPIWVSYKDRLAESILAHLTDLFVRKKNWSSSLFNLKRGKKTSKHESNKEGREIIMVCDFICTKWSNMVNDKGSRKRQLELFNLNSVSIFILIHFHAFSYALLFCFSLVFLLCLIKKSIHTFNATANLRQLPKQGHRTAPHKLSTDALLFQTDSAGYTIV